MDFAENIKQFSQQVSNIKDSIKSEAATKTSLVLPFIQLLGYNIFDPLEVMPEYTASFGVKKDARVDYAIIINKQPIILIECKSCDEDLRKHDNQLFQYFVATKAKLGILTNGIRYQIFTDLDEQNIMDSTPFFEFDLLKLKDKFIPEIKKFHKSELDLGKVFDMASKLKHSKIIKDIVDEQFKNPSDAFVRLVIDGIYPGKKTQTVVDRFRPVVNMAMNDYISELMNEKITAALKKQAETDFEADLEELEFGLTDEETKAFSIVKSILKDLCDPDMLSCQPTSSYIAIVYDNNSWKRVCRLWFKKDKKFITTPDIRKKPVRHDISDINDIYKYANYIKEVCMRYI